jgi:hypothetical protein
MSAIFYPSMESNNRRKFLVNSGTGAEWVNVVVAIQEPT